MSLPSTVEVAVVGGGPAGLAAAKESASAGCQTILLDASTAPGGQLSKQIHKFFGSRAQGAGVRGPDIATQLVSAAEDAGATICTDSCVQALYDSGRLEVLTGARRWPVAPEKMRLHSLRAERVILAPGAEENALAFSGWTQAGVMGAGAVQTMINVHRVLPGSRALMVGAGNVGLIVAYQLLQAGAHVAAVLDAAPKIGGYGVHSAKIQRLGVPILTSHTVQRAHGGDNGVRAATVTRVDEDWRPLPGTERHLEVDLICIAAGLRPNLQLAGMANCRMVFSNVLGGWIPSHTPHLATDQPRLFVAGDASGVEEATSAIEEGRLAGLSAARSLGRMTRELARVRCRQIHLRLAGLRAGPLGVEIRRAKHRLWRSHWLEADGLRAGHRRNSGVIDS